MITVIKPGMRYGSVTIPASKSQAHRQLICAALSSEPSVIICDTISNDIQATIDCLNAAGADINVLKNKKIEVNPIKEVTDTQDELYCKESGSTLRFLIPVMGALGKKCVFHMEGRLKERPISVFTDELQRHGMRITKDGSLLKCEGRLLIGEYTIPGNISSQFISGLLMALPLLKGESTIKITETIESGDYIAMTEDALKMSGICFSKNKMSYRISGKQRFAFPNEIKTEGDWSGAAFFFCIGALSDKGVLIHGLSIKSSQGDKRITELVEKFGASVEYKDNDIFVKGGKLKGCEVDAAAIPDLVPTICAMAAAASGETRIIHAKRLRMKESDRIKTTRDALYALGADIEETDDGLVIKGRKALNGGTVNSFMDHRIAMTAAVAACACDGDVTIDDCQCVSKSYPAFWEDFGNLKIK